VELAGLVTASSSLVPTLSKHAHLSPDDGICMIELVSILAGEPFSGHPRCTDPTLATIGRVVNDDLSHAARQALVPLAAGLVGRRGDARQLAPVLVQQCLTVAAKHPTKRLPVLRRHQRRAAHWGTFLRRHPRRLGRLGGAVYRRGPAQHAITAMVLHLRQVPPAERDAALREVLDAAIAATPLLSPHNQMPVIPVRHFGAARRGRRQ
jgi:hypothetical protein